MKFQISACAIAVVIATVGGEATAATFTDRVALLGQNGTFVEHGSPFGDFAITAASGSSLNSDFATFTDKFGTSPYVILNGVENFNIDVTFATEIFAFGMDVYEPVESTSTFNGCNVSTCVESTFELKFLKGGTAVDSITFAPANEVLAFIGFTSASPFDRIEIRETVGTNDNEFFGNFVSSTTPVSPVPLPASALLLLAALGGLGAVARRAHRG